VVVTTLGTADETVALKQRVTGARGHSRHEHALGDQPWSGDRDLRSVSLTLQGRQIAVSCRAVFSGFDDDVLVVIDDRTEPQDIPEQELDLLAYNVWLRPWLPDAQEKRAALLPELLRGHDVIVLAEAFHRKLVPQMLEAIVDEYPHQTPVLGGLTWPRPLGPGTKMWNGGVVVASRWPIEATDTRSFRPCMGWMDGLADKGVLYAAIRKAGRRYHLFAAHVQADPEPIVHLGYHLTFRDADVWFRRYRAQNLEIVRGFIEELELPEDEPVLIVGDLNVNRFGERGQYGRMLDILKAEAPEETSGHPSTFDCATNSWLTGDSAQWLDYALWSRTHLQPRASHVEVKLMRSRVPYRHRRQNHWDLSDHYAIRARFDFGPA
jgi:endonuclease/exonuclease/phosphatase family metal-dependent hydrolase